MLKHFNSVLTKPEKIGAQLPCIVYPNWSLQQKLIFFSILNIKYLSNETSNVKNSHKLLPLNLLEEHAVKIY